VPIPKMPKITTIKIIADIFIGYFCRYVLGFSLFWLIDVLNPFLAPVKLEAIETIKTIPQIILIGSIN